MSDHPFVGMRRFDFGDQGTFGRVLTDGLALFSGELPMRGNLPNRSCIMPGLYFVDWTWSPKFEREMYLLFDVPGRAGVRKHSANFMGDVELGFLAELNGCISLGEKLGVMRGQKALLLSKPAMRRFESHMKYKPFYLGVS